jgi:hypothetical protein
VAAHLVPKTVAAPDFACRVPEDLVVEKGQWVFVTDNTIQVMSHEDVLRYYDIREGAEPTGAARRSNGTGAHYGAAMSEQGLRVLQSLLKLGGIDRRTKEITRSLSAVDTRQASARLAQAKHHGLVTKRLPAGRARGFLWSLTDKGRARLAEIVE